VTASKQSRGKVGHLAAPPRIINSIHDFDEPAGILSTGRTSSVRCCRDARHVRSLRTWSRLHSHFSFFAISDPAAVV
jgi:hypothetical protein